LARLGIVLALLATVLLGGPLPAQAATDPPLSVDRAAVLAVLHCPASFTKPKTPVLLVHGTGSTSEESWAHSYAKTLPPVGHDVCTIDLPQRALGDIQVAAEYVVVAIHEVAARSGRHIDVLGHSQGGLEPRWALKWFPSTQALVDDYVSLSTPQHGSLDAAGICTVGTCAPAVWQQRPGSTFLNALNAGDETPGDVSYTSIYSLTDEIVPELPPPATSIIQGGRSIAVQDVCPARPVNHLGALHDAVEYALVTDAFDHPGPADPARLSATTCLGLLAPGLDPTDAAFIQAIGLGEAGLNTIVTGPKSSAEPPLMPYVLAAQTAAAAAPPAPQSAPAQPSGAPPAAAPPPREAQRSALPSTGGSPLAGPALIALALVLVTRRWH
jgi:triacylglycerol esterase/lipase EstA (alpha/beta hydrolase family)